MKEKTLNAAFVAAVLITTILVLVMFMQPDKAPEVSAEEIAARLKVAESERSSYMRRMAADDIRGTDYSIADGSSPLYETEAADLSLLEIQQMEVEAYDHAPETVVEEVLQEEEVYTDPVTEPATEAADPWGFSDEEIWEIARVAYLENGCEGYYYPTYLTACVILNRYLDWDYSSISEVIWAPGQYSTADKYTNWGGGELTISEMTWQAVYDAMADLDRNPHYQMKGGSGNLYYQHPETGECFYY